MEEPDHPGDGKRPLHRWRPHLGRAATWLTATVLTAAIGVLVSAVLMGWLSGSEDSGQPVQRAPATKTRAPPSVPDSRLVSAQQIGSFRVEDDGTSQGATDAIGQPSNRERNGNACIMTWEPDGLIMQFSNFGGADPCLYGDFCTGHVSGRDWSTAEGLQPGMPVRRMLALYPDAQRVDESGEIVRYVIDPGITPCGPDSKGGLEAWTNVGRVFALRVTFQAGGD